jgi:hypothetical protein
MTFGDIPGASGTDPAKTAKAVALAFEAEGCLNEMKAVAQNPDVSTPQAAGGVVRSFTDVAASCLADTWTAAYGVSGFMAPFYVGTLLWLADGIKLITTDLHSLIDSAIYWQGYHIYVASSQGSGPSPSPPTPTPQVTPTVPVTPAPQVTPTPAGTTETIAVSSTTGWQPTNIYLTGGEKFTVKYVSGSWTVDYRNFPYVGPGGYSNQEDVKIYQDCKYDGNVNYGVLFGIVGPTPNGAFPIGNGGNFVAVAPSHYVNGGGNDGYLYLRINDTCLTDNAGSVTVQVNTP